jgi:hypothetical protein
MPSKHQFLFAKNPSGPAINRLSGNNFGELKPRSNSQSAQPLMLFAALSGGTQQTLFKESL